MRFWGSLGSGRDMAVDLGTANTLVFIRGRGIVLFEPSVVAISEETGKVHAVGAEAKRMIGRTPATIRATRPLRHGVIADFEITEEMLRHFINRAGGSRFAFARVVLCVPSGITDVERRAVDEATRAAGARSVYLIEEPMAAAIGANLPVADAVASMVIDIGGGTTEVAVISLGGMVVWESIRVGGYEMDEAIVDYVKNVHKLMIGQETAEAAKIDVGSAWAFDDDVGDTTVAGRDLVTGLLRRVTISASDVRRALEGPVNRIVSAVKDTLERTPPELAADLGERGIVLAGGGSLLRGIDERLRTEVGLPVQMVESPLTCVAEGAGRSLDELETLDRAAKAERRSKSRSRFG
jgi:rod shape-determining protein MreB